MDIGGTAKKVQKMTKIAEKSYKKINEMIERTKRLQEDMETTSSQVDGIERELAEQRVLIEAVAQEQGVDVDEVLDAAALPAVTGEESTAETTSEGTDEATADGDQEPTDDSESASGA